MAFCNGWCPSMAEGIRVLAKVGIDEGDKLK